MRNWYDYVRDHLELPGVRRPRSEKIVEDVARQLEDFNREGLQLGMGEAEADAYALRQIKDWHCLTSDLLREERTNRDSTLERWTDSPGRKMTGGAKMLSEIKQDVWYGLRGLRRSPGFTAIAVLSLALGLGANVTVFSWIESLLLNPFPGVQADDELYSLVVEAPRGTFSSVSYPDYVDYREQSETTDIIVLNDGDASLLYENESQQVFLEAVSYNYFEVLGVRPHLGRLFLHEDEAVPGQKVAILNHDYWVSRFGSDPDIVGKIIRLNTKPYEIIGVVEEGFQGTEVGLTMGLWIPITVQRPERVDQRGSQWMRALVRLRPGSTTEQASAELSAISQRLEEQYPMEHRFRPARLYPLWKMPGGATQILGPVLLVLMVIAALVLLIACANIANLMLVRATVRRKEIAVRMSLGAGRRRVLRQILTESLLLSFLGGLVGALMTIWTSRLLLFFVPPTGLPVKLAPPLNLNVLLFAFGVATATGILFGLAPGLQAGRTDLLQALNEESTRTSGTRGRGWLRNSLVVAQVALSLILLVSAGLFVRSLRAVQNHDPGFNMRGVLVASFNLTQAGYDGDTGRAFLQELLPRLQTLQGVESAAVSNRLMLANSGRSTTSIQIEGYEPAEGEDVFASYNMVSPDFFQTLDIPVLSGRGIEETDLRGEPYIVVINQALANRYWKGRDALGGRINIGSAWHTVVGIVPDIPQQQIQEDPQPLMYLSVQQWYNPSLYVELHTSGAPALLVAPLRDVFRQLNPALPVYAITDYTSATGLATFQQRLLGNLLAVFGLLALVLASIGIYGVLAYVVGQRNHEIGIRLALGARRTQILRLVMTQGAWLVGIGMVLGGVAAVSLTRLAAPLLFEVSPTDPATFLSVAGLLLAVSLVACLIPARRATRVDPMVALRYE